MKVIIYTTILAAYIAYFPAKLSASDVKIPRIGDTSSRYMSISQENKLGSIIYSQILGSFNLISDPLITGYVQMLGNRLLVSDYNSPIKYRFLVANDPTINAFATPGGVIVINSGLIRKTKTEAELASVLAHEIAHVKARHLSRMHEESSKVNISTALSVLATVIAGTYSTGALGKTLITGQNVKAAQLTNFIRKHEKEADRLAINILVNANINPKAMSDFFKTLQKENDDRGALEFLRTHPLTENRISETLSLASKYKGNFTNDSFVYQFTSVKVSIEKINTKSFIKNYTYSKELTKTSPGRIINDYAYGLALIKEKKYKLGKEVLNDLLQILSSKNQLYIIKNYVSIALSEIYIKENKFNDAVALLESLNDIYPTDPTILYYLSHAYMKNKQYKMVISKLLPYVIEHKDHRLILKISEAGYKLKEQSLGHEYRADYLKLLGSFTSAIKYYKLALQYNMKGKTIDERITSKIGEIKKLQKNKEIL